jgi:hypothetical protein
MTPFLRYDFATGTRFVPFFDAGAGITATDISLPDLGGRFQFNSQVGLGVHWLAWKNTALTLQYRVGHISNAGLEDHNHGLNTSLVYGGASWFF